MVIFNLIKLILFLLSIYGISLLINRKFDIKMEFSIFVSISLIIIIIFLTSLIGLMQYGSVLVFIVGLFFFSYYLFKEKLKIFIFENNKLYLITIVLIIYLGLILTNLKLIHFDNFSHWAVMAKQMINLNNLPNNTNMVSAYITYPPASAYFIYHFCNIVSHGEYYMLFGQSIFILISLSVIYPFIKPKNKFHLIFLILYVLFVITLNNSVADLLVDTLLGVFGLSSFATILYYKDDLKKATILMIPINTALLLIKNSAIFFFVINVICILYFLFKQRKTINFKNKLLYIFLTVVPYMIYYLWKLRNNIIFGDRVKLSSQTTSFYSYKNNFLSKGLSDLVKIIKTFIKGFFNIINPTVLIFFLVVLFIVVTLIIFRKNKEKIDKRIIFVVILIYGLYNCGLLFGYIFSMTLDEALRLACYDRYLSSITIMIVGLTLIWYMKNNFNNKILNVLIIIFFTIFIFISPNKTNLIGKDNYKNSEKEKIENILKGIPLSNNNKYLVICTKSKYNGYITNVIKYYIFNKNMIIISDLNSLNNYKLQDYDYVITYDIDDKINEYLKNYTNYNNKMGWYKIKGV